MTRRPVRRPVLGGVSGLALVLAACGGSAPTPSTSTASTASLVPVVPVGFDSERVRLTEPDGTTCERCLLVAATPEDRRRGLMGVTELGGYDGMVFVYDTPTRSAFWMKDTVVPLSISFYDETGATLAQFAMEPCVADPCPSFGPEEPFSMAVEVAAGRLEELGFTTTARLERSGRPCEPSAR